MKLAQVFQAIEETQFLKKLSFQSKLFFVGDSAPLEYIKNFFGDYPTAAQNYYFDLSVNQLAELGKFSNLASYQAIVLVSLEDEATLLSQVNRQLDPSSQPLVLRLFADIFINLLCERPLLQPSPKQNRKPSLSYAIVTTPRSGSTYLCDLLDSTAIAGHPAEHLRLATQELARRCNFDYLPLLDNLMEYRTTGNDVFGTKLISHFLFELRQSKSDFKYIFQAINKFILLIRQDKVAQAVSLVLAQKTEVWHLHHNPQQDAKQSNYQSKLARIEIDEALLNDVEQKVIFIEKQEQRLKKILTHNKIDPLIVVYEDILDNAPGQISRILDFLQLPSSEQNVEQINSGVKRMPSTISQQIIQQYRARTSAVL